MARHRSRNRTPLPRLLMRLVHAATTLPPPAPDAALREFGHLALTWIPARGVFVPNDEQISTLVEQVATEHLNLGVPRKAFFRVVKEVEPFELRDAIGVAQNHLQSVSDEAHFYAGLAFGVTIADLS